MTWYLFSKLERALLPFMLGSKLFDCNAVALRADRKQNLVFLYAYHAQSGARKPIMDIPFAARPDIESSRVDERRVMVRIYRKITFELEPVMTVEGRTPFEFETFNNQETFAAALKAALNGSSRGARAHA